MLDRSDQHPMRRALVVEAVAVALMADGVDAFGKLGVTLLRVGFRRLPVRVVGGIGRVLRKGVQDVGEHQLLMLLLVVQADLQNARDLGPRRAARLGDQRFSRRIDMRAVLRDLDGIRPRDQPTLRPRMARTGGDVIRVEQEREALVVNRVARHVRLNQKRLEEPGRVRAMPLRSGLRPASTGSPDPQPRAARRGARSRRARGGRLRGGAGVREQVVRKRLP